MKNKLAPIYPGKILREEFMPPPRRFNEIVLKKRGITADICLAQEIHAAAVLMDDRAGRSAAIRCGLAVVGTIGLLEQAAAHGFIELPATLARLRQTNARLDPELIRAAIARDQARQQKKQPLQIGCYKGV